MSAPTEISHHLEHRQKRHKALFLAVLTSLFSKGGNLLLMLLAFPLARRVLGEERFGLFGTIQMLLFLVSMTDLGIGTGVSRRLTVATSLDQQDSQRRVFSTGFFLLAGLTAAFGLAATLVLTTAPLPWLFGPSVGPWETEFRQNLWLALGLFLSLFLSSYLLRGREAYQEIHLYNTLGAISNVAAAGLLWFGVRQFPELWWLVVSIYGPMLVAFLANGLSLLKQRPFLIPRPSLFDKSLALMLWREGWAIFIMMALSPILLREGLRIILAHQEDLGAVGNYTILAQLGFFMLGFVNMLTLPMNPALVDATARRDVDWVRKMHRKTVLLLALGAVVIPSGCALIGPSFVDFWLQDDVKLDAFTMGAFGVYFAATLWSIAHALFFSATGALRKGSQLLAVEIVLVLLANWWGIRHWGMAGGFWAGSACLVLITGWMHPLLLRKHLADLEKPSATGHPDPLPA